MLPLVVMAWMADLDPSDPQAQQAVLFSVLASVVMVAMAYLLHQRKQQAEDYKATLELMVRTDPLTQLLNRRALTEDLASGLGQHDVLMLMDLDGFKQVNDEIGHDAGDRLLQVFAHVLTENTRKSRNDRVYRIGGDEFVAMLAGTEIEMAESIASRIIRRFQVQGSATAKLLPIGVSVGAAARVEGETADDWLKRADAVMYAAKRSGGGLRWNE